MTQNEEREKYFVTIDCDIAQGSCAIILNISIRGIKQTNEHRDGTCVDKLLPVLVLAKLDIRNQTPCFTIHLNESCSIRHQWHYVVHACPSNEPDELAERELRIWRSSSYCHLVASLKIHRSVASLNVTNHV